MSMEDGKLDGKSFLIAIVVGFALGIVGWIIAIIYFLDSVLGTA